MVDSLRRRWVLVLVVTVAAAVGISLLESSYNDLQVASDATEFRHTLGSHGRALAATGCDIVFAAGYAALAVIALRVLEVPQRLVGPAHVLVLASALFDELENLTLIRNIVAERTITDGWITVMQVPGTLKWIGSPVFLALLLGLAYRAVRRRRRGQT